MQLQSTFCCQALLIGMQPSLSDCSEDTFFFLKKEDFLAYFSCLALSLPFIYRTKQKGIGT